MKFQFNNTIKVIIVSEYHCSEIANGAYVKIELIIVALFFSISLNAQVKFTATAQPATCQVGETIQVQFTLSGTNGGDFKAPSFKGFTVVQGPMRQQMQINSQISFSFIYVIKADIEGKFTFWFG